MYFPALFLTSGQTTKFRIRESIVLSTNEGDFFVEKNVPWEIFLVFNNFQITARFFF